MTSRLDKALKWLWLVNGVALFPALAAIGLILASEMMDDLWRPDRDGVAIAPTTGTPIGPRAIRYDPPGNIKGTEASIITVRYGRAFQEATEKQYVRIAGSGSKSASFWDGPVVNVIFLNSEEGTQHLLLDRPAYIWSVDWPHEEETEQEWISYQMALEDSNGDGQLDEDDDATLFLSDLDGRNLRRILGDGLVVEWHGAHHGGAQILIYALDRSAGESGTPVDQLPQQALLFDIETGETAPFSDLNGLVRIAGEALAK